MTSPDAVHGSYTDFFDLVCNCVEFTSHVSVFINGCTKNGCTPPYSLYKESSSGKKSTFTAQVHIILQNWRLHEPLSVVQPLKTPIIFKRTDSLLLFFNSVVVRTSGTCLKGKGSTLFVSFFEWLLSCFYIVFVLLWYSLMKLCGRMMV